MMSKIAVQKDQFPSNFEGAVRWFGVAEAPKPKPTYVPHFKGVNVRSVHSLEFSLSVSYMYSLS